MDHSDTLKFIEYSICGSNIDPMRARECESVWLPDPVEQNIYYAVELDTMYICFKHFFGDGAFKVRTGKRKIIMNANCSMNVHK